MEKIFKLSKAELIAKKVLSESGLDDPTEMPIEEIILGRGAFYSEKPLVGKDGEIVTIDNKSMITVNSNIAFTGRKRFVAAHELGHFEMHRKISPIITDTEQDLLNWFQGGKHEVEANEFASEFLMPSDQFYNECKNKIFNPSVIDHLSSRFQVSKTAAILKFVNAGNFPICIVFCINNRMQWFKVSDDFGAFLEFEKNSPTPSGSVANELATTKKQYPKDELVQSIWKSDWFRMREDEQDKGYFEYCLTAGSSDYMLSVIWTK